eukprot:TRINITY_DN4361_c0_g2_i1.p1 TRINITY_DN4361_c0_g2~~TRINITY_DN4361_c0_g2_i1.p1  ORF type:complete len:473 (+),score=35.21 TRINITY_DN4361_c0_g2_i1:121-1539(+)
MRFRAPEPQPVSGATTPVAGPTDGEAPPVTSIQLTPPSVSAKRGDRLPGEIRNRDVPGSLTVPDQHLGDDDLVVIRSHTQIARRHSDDGKSLLSSPRGARRGSYCGDASAQPRARRWTQQRTMSIARSRQSERREQGLEGSVHGWGSGRGSRPVRDSSDLLTADQVNTYHKLLEGLQHIQGLHDCVDHPCGNIYWDFRTKRCLPGRVWKDKMPENVKAKVDRDFTQQEVSEIEHQIHLHSAPSQPPEVEPRALFVIGPAAAGKSAVRLKTEDMLQVKLSDYVEVDGDEFREKHRGWMDVLKGDRTTGYKDALNVLLKYTRKLKKRVLEEAVKGRKNLLIPSTASNFDKLTAEVETVRSKGYRVDVVGLVVSYREARARALNRAHENGRWNDGTPEKWEAAMRAIIHFMEPESSDWCIVFDNQDFNNPTTIFSRTHSLAFVEGIVGQYRLDDADFAEQERRKRAAAAAANQQH